MKEQDWVRQVILEEAQKSGLQVLRILLFGSRARGDHRRDSDWDIYVMVDKRLPFHERQNLASRIRWALAQQDIDGDVIIQDERTVREREMNPGYLTYYVLREGREMG